MPAPKGNQNAKGNRGGRPSAYRAEYTRMARRIAMLGATDAELADVFGVAVSTIARWKLAHVEFRDALKAGKVAADGAVAQSLYRRAVGYSHKAVKIVTVAQGNNQGSVVEEVPYTERYAPDTTACIFWLKNRRPNDWRDRQPDAPDADPMATARAVRDALAALDALDAPEQDA